MAANDLNNPGIANSVNPEFGSVSSLAGVTLASSQNTPCALTADSSGNLLVNGQPVSGGGGGSGQVTEFVFGVLPSSYDGSDPSTYAFPFSVEPTVAGNYVFNLYIVWTGGNSPGAASDQYIARVIEVGPEGNAFMANQSVEIPTTGLEGPSKLTNYTMLTVAAPISTTGVTHQLWLQLQGSPTLGGYGGPCSFYLSGYKLN